MKYFNSQKLAFNFDIKEEDFIGLGTQGSIFKYGSQNCIKIYYDTDVPVFDQEMFDKFKSLDLKSHLILEMQNILQLHYLILFEMT